MSITQQTRDLIKAGRFTEARKLLDKANSEHLAPTSLIKTLLHEIKRKESIHLPASTKEMQKKFENDKNIEEFNIFYCIMLMEHEVLVSLSPFASLIEQNTGNAKVMILLNGFNNKKLTSRLGKHSNVRVFSNSKNLGVAGGRNFLYQKVLEEANKDDFVVNLDNDIYLPQDFHASVCETCRSNYNEKTGIIGATILDYKKKDVQKYINDNFHAYTTYLSAKVYHFFRSDIHTFLSKHDKKLKNLLWHIGMHQDFREVYIDRKHLFDPASNFIDNLAKDKQSFSIEIGSFWPISNAAGCFQLFRVSHLLNIGLLDNIFSPYFWEDTDFSYRLTMNGLKNYGSSNIVLLHGTDQRHEQRKERNAELIHKANEYRARCLFLFKHDSKNVTKNYDKLIEQINATTNEKDHELISAKRLGIKKGINQIAPDCKEAERYEVISSLIEKRLSKFFEYNNEINLVEENNTVKILDFKVETEGKNKEIISENKISKVQMSQNLKKFHEIHNKESCILLCNGPSLKSTRLGILSSLNIPIFASNSAYKLVDNLDLNIDYFVCEDNHVIYDNLEAIKFLPTKNKFVPDKYFNLFNEEDNINFMPTNWDAYFKSKATYENPNFSLDVSKEIFVGQTVTYLMLQLIYYMGFETTYIVGLDFSYTIPKNVRIDNNSIDMDSDDPNHFFGDYFGKGKQWHFPKLDSCMQSYILANNRFRSANRTIVDATKGGKLNVFHKSETIQGINIHSSSDNCLEFERYVEDYFNGLNAKKQFVKLINSQEFFANSNDIDDNEVAIYYHGLKRGYQLDKSILLSSNIPGFSWFDSTLPIKYLDIASSEVNDNAVTESTIIGLRICRFNSKSKELVRNCDLKGMTGIRLEKMIYFAKI